MREYITLFLFLMALLSIPLVVAPYFYLNSLSIRTKTIIQAEEVQAKGERVKIIATTDKWLIDVSKVSSDLRDKLELPDLLIIPGGGREITMKIEGRCVSGCEGVDEIYFYYLTDANKSSKKINLTVVVEPTYEATIIKDNECIGTVDIREEAEGLGIRIGKLEDLRSKDNRENLIKDIFRKYVLPSEYVIDEKMLETPSVREENITKGLIIEGKFLVNVSKVSPIIALGKEKVRIGGSKTLTLSRTELQKPYPRLRLVAFYKGGILSLSNGRPMLGCINGTGDLEKVLESYYKWLLQGRAPILANYTGMLPGSLAQKSILDIPELSEKEKTSYIEEYIRQIMYGELKEKPEDIANKMFWSTIVSWIVNLIFVSLVLSTVIYVLRRAR
jgi:hypothetical protein